MTIETFLDDIALPAVAKPDYVHPVTEAANRSSATKTKDETGDIRIPDEA
jgi:hypothetical protein